MKCSAFIAMSADGYIATADGGVGWLEHSIGNAARAGEAIGDGGFAALMESVDCMIMGRGCMEKLAEFDLPDEQWPYGDIPIHALSRSLTSPPENLAGRVTMYSGAIPALLASLAERGLAHAYVDGGATITSFLQLGLLDELCVTQVPVLLGGGLPLFGAIDHPIALQDTEARVYSNGFIQWRYRVSRQQRHCR